MTPAPTRSAAEQAIFDFLQTQDCADAEFLAQQVAICADCTTSHICNFHWNLIDDAMASHPETVEDAETGGGAEVAGEAITIVSDDDGGSDGGSDLSRDPAVAALFDRESYSESPIAYCDGCGGQEIQLINHGDGEYICVYCFDRRQGQGQYDHEQDNADQNHHEQDDHEQNNQDHDGDGHIGQAHDEDADEHDEPYNKRRRQ